MNENDFDRTARAWLDRGPTRMSDRAVLSALEEIHTTRQRRAWMPARRATPLNMFARAAVAAVLVLGVGLLAINVLPGQPGGVGSQPSATPAPSASPPPSSTPSAAAIPVMTQPFTSSNNGFSLRYPDGAEIEPAKLIWNPYVEQDNAGFDFVHSPTYTLRGASVEAPDAVSIDDWIDQSVVHFASGGCGVPRGEQLEVTIDGQPGRIWEGCPGEIEATVVVGRRLYLFTLFGDGITRAVFDAYASTIDLRPEEAAGAPSPSAS
jgi:hypothetical protein